MKYLTIKPEVHLTPSITRTAELMDKYFEGVPSIITSGLRTEEEQLGIIIKKLAKNGKDREFPEFMVGIMERWPANKTTHITEINRDLFWWQRAWSRLLNISDIVNPPLPAELIFDYYRPGSTRNKKGEIIQISRHQRGLSLDIGGGDNLTEKSKCVLKAHESGECFIQNFLIERVNNAVHVDTLQIGGGTG